MEEAYREFSPGHYWQDGGEVAWDGELIGATPGKIYKVVNAQPDRGGNRSPWSWCVTFVAEGEAPVLRFYQMLRHQRYDIGPELWNQYASEGRACEVITRKEDITPDPVVRCGYMEMGRSPCAAPASCRACRDSEDLLVPRCAEHMTVDIRTDMLAGHLSASYTVVAFDNPGLQVSQ